MMDQIIDPLRRRDQRLGFDAPPPVAGRDLVTQHGIDFLLDRRELGLVIGFSYPPRQPQNASSVVCAASTGRTPRNRQAAANTEASAPSTIGVR